MNKIHSELGTHAAQATVSAAETATTAKATSAAAYGASITTAAGGALSVQDYALWGGLAIAALTFLLNGIFQLLNHHRQNRLADAELRLKQAQINNLLKSKSDN